MYMHPTLIEDGDKPSREPQRRLNPIMLEFEQKEVLKLLDEGVIYPISKSKWVSLAHVVSNKGRFTVKENAKGFVPKLVQMGWWMCIGS